MSKTLFVSVIIPVYNDQKRLEICLQALEEQSCPKETYEVIVVDNGSDESIEPIVARYSHAKACYEAYPGSYAARNKGISLSRGEVVAFIDADSIPARDWIERGLVHLLEMENCGAVGGRVDVFFKEPDHPTAVELYESLMYYNMKMFTEKMALVGAGNLFTFKRVLDHVGFFDNDLKSSGDREWTLRVLSYGYEVFYADDVRLDHPARHSLDQLCWKEIRIAGGLEDYSKKVKTSFLKKLNREFFLGFFPPVMTLLRLQQKVPFQEKIKVIFIWFILKYVRMKERLRIKLLHGTSAR